MTLLDSQVERVYAAGNHSSGNLSLPEGARELIVTLTTPEPNWPAVSDGTIILALDVSRGSGAPFIQEWSDTFQHKLVLRNGVPVTQLSFGAALQAEFGPDDRCRYRFDTTVSFRSAVSIDANIAARAA